MIKVRIAPSPTGFLHIGTARTALFNYLFAKKNKGIFIVRIEDTDFERSKPEYEKEILESLSWLGLKWDDFCKQSKRIKIYAKYLKKLLKENKAYYCFCGKEELEAQKENQLARGQAPRYSGKCAKLSPKDAEKLKKEGKPSVIRFRVPPEKVIFDDLIRGKIEFDSSLFGDIVIAKDENTPLYNFACVVDDYEMKITHIIRGEDHIMNTPKQILMQNALGFSSPQFAHIPFTLGPDHSKLSKRHGATAISEYKKQGYLAEALINFMALLGWNPDTDKEIFTIEELIDEFSLEKMQKSAAIFNIEKLNWINGYYIRKKPLEELTQLCAPYLVKAGLITPLNKFLISNFKPSTRAKLGAGLVPHRNKVSGAGFLNKSKILNSKFKIKETGERISFKQLCDIVRLSQERLKKLSEIGELSDFFFKQNLDYDKELLRWKNMTDEELKNSLSKIDKIISEIEEKNFKKEILEKLLMEESAGVGDTSTSSAQDRGKLFWPLRAALSGKRASPGPCEIAEVLGKEKTLKRIREAKEKV